MLATMIWDMCTHAPAHSFTCQRRVASASSIAFVFARVIIIVLVFAFALCWSSSYSSIIIPIVRFVCVILALLHAQRHNMHPHGERNCAACTSLKEASFGIRSFAQVLCRDISTPFRWANVLWLFKTLKR